MIYKNNDNPEPMEDHLSQPHVWLVSQVRFQEVQNPWEDHQEEPQSRLRHQVSTIKSGWTSLNTTARLGDENLP